MTDAELLRGSIKDGALFRLVYERHALAVHGFLRVRVGDDEIALELTAETFAQALASRKRFRPSSGNSARPWLFGIAKNLASTWGREQRIEAVARRRYGIELQLEQDASDVAAEFDDVDISSLDVLGALEQLPEGQQSAVRLRVIQRLPYAVIAEKLNCTPEAAKKRVTRGLKLMNRELEVNSHE